MRPFFVRTVFAACALAFSQAAFSYVYSGSPECTVAVTDPMYTGCLGSYTLDKGENDVTNGDEFNIVSQILNDGGFGDEDWTFGAKIDDSGLTGTAGLFSVSGIDATAGTLDFSGSSLADLTTAFDIAISFKAGNSFSIYYWEAPLLSDFISWTTDGVAENNHEFPQALSHVSVYVRGGSVDVPEPSVFALLALGMAGLAWSRRKAA